MLNRINLQWATEKKKRSKLLFLPAALSITEIPCFVWWQEKTGKEIFEYSAIRITSALFLGCPGNGVIWNLICSLIQLYSVIQPWIGTLWSTCQDIQRIRVSSIGSCHLPVYNRHCRVISSTMPSCFPSLGTLQCYCKIVSSGHPILCVLHNIDSNGA